MILAPVRDRRPQAIIMWGVGLAESDQDLMALYSRWSEHADAIDIINPDPDVTVKSRALFNCEIRHFASIVEWEQRKRS